MGKISEGNNFMYTARGSKIVEALIYRSARISDGGGGGGGCSSETKDPQQIETDNKKKENNNNSRLGY